MSTASIREKIKTELQGLAGWIASPGAYRPRRPGQVKDPLVDAGLELTIEPIPSGAGDDGPIVFAVTFRNVGSDAIRVPRDPWVQFVWTYSNGKRNNAIYEDPSESLCKARDIVVLEPGETLAQRVTVMTDYFRCRGITEFRAVFKGVSNPISDPGALWQGYVISNAEDVLVNAMEEEAAWTWSRESYHGLLAMKW